MEYKTIIYEKKDGMAKITLNRPEALNARNRAMVEELEQAWIDIRDDEEVGVVILSGAGRSFCAGADLKELLGADPNAARTGGGMKHVGAMDLAIPSICAVQGYALTGGLELAMECDMIIAAEDAKFGDTHAHIGLVGATALTLLPRLVGRNKAKEMSFTGNFISAQEALQWGLVNHVVPIDQLMPTAEKIAKDILSCKPGVVQVQKRCIDKGVDLTHEEHINMVNDESNRFRATHHSVTTAEERRKTREQVMGRGRKQ